MPESALEAKPKEHMPQLDGLRAFAVFAVLLLHYVPFGKPLHNIFLWGQFGVHLFFVISGFLITGILLRCRVHVDAAKQTSSQVLKAFYARRFLRIFPIYYLTLGIIALFWFSEFETRLPWMFSYLVNFYDGTHPYESKAMGHFWTLCVEEQFYLVWPIIVLFSPRKALRWIFITAVVLGPAYRSLCVLWVRDPNQVYDLGYLLPFGSFDTLGLGALLALLFSEGENAKKDREVLARCGLGAGLPLLLALSVLDYFSAERLMQRLKSPPEWAELYLDQAVPLVLILGSLSVGLTSVWLVSRASSGFSGIAGSILSAPGVRYVGKISYGLYVLHMFIPRMWDAARAALHIEGDLHWVPRAIVFTISSIGIAAISWYLFENPINELKRHFEYESPAGGGVLDGKSTNV